MINKSQWGFAIRCLCRLLLALACVFTAGMFETPLLAQVHQSLTITMPRSPVVVTQGLYFELSFRADPGPVTFAVAGFPKELQFDTTAGVLKGTPATTGEWRLSVLAKSSSDIDSATVSLQVVPPAVPSPRGGSGPATVATNLPKAQVSQATNSKPVLIVTLRPNSRFRVGGAFEQRLRNDFEKVTLAALQQDRRFAFVTLTNLPPNLQGSPTCELELGITLLRLNPVSEGRHSRNQTRYSYRSKAQITISWLFKRNSVTLVSDKADGGPKEGQTFSLPGVQSSGSRSDLVAPKTDLVLEHALENGNVPYVEAYQEAYDRILRQLKAVSIE